MTNHDLRNEKRNIKKNELTIFRLDIIQENTVSTKQVQGAVKRLQSEKNIIPTN